MPQAKAEAADLIAEYYRDLVRRNHAFCCALVAALESGAESAAAVTATVRTGKARQNTNSDSTPGTECCN
jgi:hypothetical protein